MKDGLSKEKSQSHWETAEHREEEPQTADVPRIWNDMHVGVRDETGKTAYVIYIAEDLEAMKIPTFDQLSETI